METKFEKQSPTTGRLTIEIEKADVQPEIDKKLKEYAKKAKIKGFRQGHVPIGYVKNLYGKSLLVDEVINKVSSSVNQYIIDNKINAVGDPMPEKDTFNVDWDNSDKYTFAYDIGFASDFKIDESKFPKITKYKIKPSEDQLKNSIEDVQKKFGDDLEPEAVEIGDLVFGTIKQESTNFESRAGIPTERVKKGTQKIFKGLEVGSSIKFDIKNLFDDTQSLGFALGKSNDEVEKLSGEFELTVEKISRIAPAKLDTALFDKVLGPGKAKNEKEFKEQLTKIIEENYDRESKIMFDYDVENMLVDNTKIDLPDQFLKDWLFKINDESVSREDIDKEYDQFARGLRLDLIRNQYATEKGIKVEYPQILDEAKSEIRNYFNQSGGPGFEGMEEFIDKMAVQQLQENKDNAVRKYSTRAFNKIVLEKVEEDVKTDTKEVFVEEFNEIAKEKYSK